jgi:hypothetical protein
MDDRNVMHQRLPTRRARTAAFALLVLGVACGGGGQEPAARPGASSPPVTSPGPASTEGPNGGTTPGPPATPRDGGLRTVSPPPAPADGGEPGSNAAAYLQARVPELVVEIDAVDGKGPAQQTIDLLRERLGSVVDKPGGIRFLPVGDAAAGDGDWSVAELQAAERRHRGSRGSAGVASLYLLFVDGAHPKEDGIGVAYSASSAAIFSDQIEEAATLLVTEAEIERAVTIHEVGHLLSLVNLGYTSSRDHEDAEYRGHSSNPDSVMYWAVDNVGVASLLGGRAAPPDRFDADDLADLAAIRSGKAP